MKKAIHAIVKGRVQGVYYRASTRNKAKSLELTGWVKNLPNGDVEFLAIGEEDMLDELIKWAWDGPDYAQVTEVITETLEYIPDFKDFSVRYE
jgi:acylphosphatase